MGKLEHPEADITLLHLPLPGLSGIEVLKRIKEQHPKVRVIMVSAIDQLDLRSQAQQYGAAGYVTKPFDFSPQTWSAAFQPVTPSTP